MFMKASIIHAINVTTKLPKKINLKRHKRVVHEGIKYKCEQCDKFISNLNQHKLSVHLGIKYKCDQCNYKATQKINLKLHKMSVHEGIKYQCDQCNHKATRKNSLKRHKMTAHLDMKPVYLRLYQALLKSC